MSTSDQHPHAADRSEGNGQLTRKQLREARLTGSTPVVTPAEAESARLAAQAGAPDAGSPGAVEAEPLTRRQMREQERTRTDAVTVPDEVATPVEGPPAAPSDPAPARSPQPSGMITDVPRPSASSRRRAAEATDDELDGVDDADQSVAPVSVSAVMRAEEAERSRRAGAADAPTPPQPAASSRSSAEPASTTSAEQASTTVPPVPATPAAEAAEIATAAPERPRASAVPTQEAPRTASAASDSDRSRTDGAVEPTVNPGFGQRVLSSPPQAPSRSFDALIDDSTGSHHAAPNALIFQQAPGALSLSGPIASTGEILVTGSYDLPAGLGSRGHADGAADGKDVDLVLVDGELAPASSPTPIAASAAIGTIKPAGEVIRPPEPEKGNRLMLALTITAGALAVALVGALIVAITTGAFS